MHRRSSGSAVDDDTEDPRSRYGAYAQAQPRSPTPPEQQNQRNHALNSLDSSEKQRPEVARTGTSFDIRRDGGSSTPRSRNSSTWRTPTPSAQGSPDREIGSGMMPLTSQRLPMEASPDGQRLLHSRRRNPWLCSILTAVTTLFALVFLLSTLRSFAARQVGSNGCGIPMMSPTFIRLLGFDTEHTRFASKYNLFLYREEGVDPYDQENIGVCCLSTCEAMLTK